MSSWAAEEETDSDEEVQQPVSPTPVVTDSAPAPRPSRAPAKSTPMVGLMLGINFDAHIEDIEYFLNHHDIKFVHIDMLEAKDGQFSGRAKVEFSEDSSFERFIGLNGAEFMNKDIITKEWETRGAPRGGNGGRRGGDRDRDDRRPRPASGGFNDTRRQPQEYAPRGERDFPPRGGNRDYPPRDRGDRGDRDRHSNSHRNNSNTNNAPTAAAAPAERPRLQLAPRTKPIEEIGKPEARADIFGGGRPHDELEFQRRKHLEKSTDATGETTGTEQPSLADDNNNNNSKKGRKENPKPASAGGEKRERKDKKERKERNKESSEQQDATLTEDMTKLQVSEASAAAPAVGEVDGDFTIVERGGKKKTSASGPAPASSSSNAKRNNNNSNNNKGGKNGPPRQEHTNSRNSNRNKDSHSNINNNKATTNAGGAKKEAVVVSSTPPTVTSAPSPKVPVNAANKTAFASLADDSDQDD